MHPALHPSLRLSQTRPCLCPSLALQQHGLCAARPGKLRLAPTLACVPQVRLRSLHSFHEPSMQLSSSTRAATCSLAWASLSRAEPPTQHKDGEQAPRVGQCTGSILLLVQRRAVREPGQPHPNPSFDRAKARTTAAAKPRLRLPARRTKRNFRRPDLHQRKPVWRRGKLRRSDELLLAVRCQLSSARLAAACLQRAARFAPSLDQDPSSAPASSPSIELPAKIGRSIGTPSRPGQSELPLLCMCMCF